ncbi:MAG TPA: hypothetical protein PLN06_11400 [Bacteroidales bacterium]|nr:hypothetical protein [Bacteroidales bacterium]
MISLSRGLNQKQIKELNVMKNYIIMINFCFIWVFSLCSISCGSKTQQAEIKDIKQYVTQNYNNLESLPQIEKAINKLLLNKKQDAQNDYENTKVNGQVTEYIIQILKKMEQQNFKQSLKLYCLLYQYIETYNNEYLSDVMNNHFYSDTSSVINVLSNLDNDLMSEFRNEQFKMFLYSNICKLPRKITESPSFNSDSEKKKMKEKLNSLKTLKNKDVVEKVIQTF